MCHVSSNGSQWHLIDLIPSLSKVFSLLLQDEKQRKLGKRLYTESSALAIKINASSIKGFNKCKSGRPQCTHCGILGHVVYKCYKLHGVHKPLRHGRMHKWLNLDLTRGVVVCMGRGSVGKGILSRSVLKAWLPWEGSKICIDMVLKHSQKGK